MYGEVMPLKSKIKTVIIIKQNFANCNTEIFSFAKKKEKFQNHLTKFQKMV
ncbi:hypothetical protein HMPREF0379_0320 [[Eubacterium] yurii subsp. margaretiae ATCC 43715]|nr:hypothetical protein HMPREF0379_0320 [[Eubacterium] yurii subsp. margaretiae ATCC 43715]